MNLIKYLIQFEPITKTNQVVREVNLGLLAPAHCSNTKVDGTQQHEQHSGHQGEGHGGGGVVRVCPAHQRCQPR